MYNHNLYGETNSQTKFEANLMKNGKVTVLKLLEEEEEEVEEEQDEEIGKH